MRIKKTDPARHIKEQLLEEMNQLNQSLETVHSNFENVSDPDLIRDERPVISLQISFKTN